MKTRIKWDACDAQIRKLKRDFSAFKGKHKINRKQWPLEGCKPEYAIFNKLKKRLEAPWPIIAFFALMKITKWPLGLQ